MPGSHQQAVRKRRHLPRHAAEIAVTMLLASTNARGAPELSYGIVYAQDTRRDMQSSLHRHKSRCERHHKDRFHSAERTARRTKVFDLSSCIDFRFSPQYFLIWLRPPVSHACSVYRYLSTFSSRLLLEKREFAFLIVYRNPTQVLDGQKSQDTT